MEGMSFIEVIVAIVPIVLIVAIVPIVSIEPIVPIAAENYRHYGHLQPCFLWTVYFTWMTRYLLVLQKRSGSVMCRDFFLSAASSMRYAAMGCGVSSFTLFE